MTDRFPISSSAFSDLPPQPSCQSCRLALHRAPGGLSAAALAHDSLESLGEFLSRFFDPLGETVRGPSFDIGSRSSRHERECSLQKKVSRYMVLDVCELNKAALVTSNVP